jgi:tellurite resistance protein
MKPFENRRLISTKKDGSFYCPQCKSTSNYKHKKVTEYFATFSLPIIPLGTIGDYVECQTCLSTYAEEVINAKKDRNSFLPVFHKPMRKLLIKMVLADGVIDAKEKIMLKETIEKLTKTPINNSDLDVEIALAKNDNLSIKEYLKEVGPQLNDNSKELILKASLLVANSDGGMNDSERALIVEISESLKMSRSFLNGLLAETDKSRVPA